MYNVPQAPQYETLLRRLILIGLTLALFPIIIYLISNLLEYLDGAFMHKSNFQDYYLMLKINIINNATYCITYLYNLRKNDNSLNCVFYFIYCNYKNSN